MSQKPMAARLRATFVLALGALFCTLTSLAVFARIGPVLDELLAVQLYLVGIIAAAGAVGLARWWARDRRLGAATLVLLGVQVALAALAVGWVIVVDPPFG